MVVILLLVYAAEQNNAIVRIILFYITVLNLVEYLRAKK